MKVMRSGFVWDFLLCTCMATSAAISIQAGFNVRESVETACVTAACCATLVGCMLLASAKTRSVLPVLGAFVAVSLVILVAAVITSTSESLIDDVPDNRLIPALVAVATTGIVYAATRKVGTCAIAFVAGFFACSLMQFLYQENHVSADVVFVLSAVAMMAYRNFATSITSARVAAKTNFGSGFVISVACSVALVCIGCGVFYFAIAPLNPPSASVKLIQEYRKLPEILAHNPLEVSKEVDGRIQSSKYDDEMRTTTYEKPGEDGVEIPAQGDSMANNPDDNQDENRASYDAESGEEGFEAMGLGSLTPLQWWPVIVACVLLLIAASFIAKIALRRRWYGNVCKLEADAQVKQLYQFFVRRLGKVGIGKDAAQTPLEFATANASALDSFAQVGGVSYRDITNTFMDAIYGNSVPSEEQLRQYHQYYASFYKNCRSFVGKFKYLRKFFSL